jgi:NADPH:quinone reductase-like Zn-dependent oxidoreductase
MRALVLDAPGGLERIAVRALPTPAVRAGEVLVRVRASSLNYHDYVVANGRVAVPDGRILMSDGAGEVVDTGAGVRDLRPGDKVFSVFYPLWENGPPEPGSRRIIPGETADGWGAEYVAAPASWVTPMPAGYSFAEAASLTCAGLTAWRGVVVEGRVKPGDTVLVQGTGGVSIFALQFAKAAGATVVATSSSAAKLERLQALGADVLINYRETPEWGEAAVAATGGRGVDIVVEIGGAGTLAQSIAACRIGGRIALIGALAGARGETPTAAIFLKQLTVHGIAVGSRAQQLEMVRGIEANGVRPVIDSLHPLEGLPAAYERQAAQQHFGKICLEF